MSCVVYQKYIKFNQNGSYLRRYIPLMIYNGRQRLSRRDFRKASQAVFYGHNLAERASRMLAKRD